MLYRSTRDLTLTSLSRKSPHKMQKPLHSTNLITRTPQNMIRQYTWKDHYREHADEFLNSGAEIELNITDARNVGDRMHADHCFETLRLVLMCNADVTPSLIINNTNKPHGTKAYFNTFHKCRNFDRIVDWQEKHEADSQEEH